MTGQLTVVAHLRALNGQIEQTKTFLMGLIEPTRAEPGCVEYWLHQDNDDPAEFTFYENWTNRREWDKHRRCRTCRSSPTSRTRCSNCRSCG
jgi:quinol monooxygenase YgiN